MSVIDYSLILSITVVLLIKNYINGSKKNKAIFYTQAM